LGRKTLTLRNGTHRETHAEGDLGYKRAMLFAFEGATVDVGERRILGPVDAAIPDGGVTVLVGPSGSGKSTLLRLCNRLEVPSAGRVLFRGDDVAGLDPLKLRRTVGMVFQRPTPFPGTVRDNLLVATPDAPEALQADALRRAGLPRAFLDRDTSGISVGEAQRACLARTLVTEPGVLLADEVTSALDVDNRLALERLACALARDGVPVVWVTHDLDQVGRVADWVLSVVDGRVDWSGTAAELVEREGPRAR
jgi:putative ABC transport system ATP-binding protein